MIELSYEDQEFNKVTYTSTFIKGREFQSCNFNHCDFSNSDFSSNKFLDCVFKDCNLSLTKLKGTTLNNVAFKNCKIMGVDFSVCQEFLFSIVLEEGILDYSSFMGRKMNKTHFFKISLKDVNFSQANLSGSSFEETDLLGALFNRTDLTNVNFYTAFNFSIDPELNIVKNAVFSRDRLSGLLDKYKIKVV